MAEFKVGDIVIYTNSQEKGVILEVCPAARGRQMYKVNIDNSIRNCLETNLMADVDLSDPFKRLEQKVFGNFLDFTKLNTSFKIKNTSNNTISTLKASNTIFKAYQFKPLLKFLNSDNRRILVADEVGLGKTIEAGHIMLELKARKELKNSLIICPKSLNEKWKNELKIKFNLNFKIYDNINEFISDLIDKPYSIKAILNYEKIRPKKNKNNLKRTGNDKLTIHQIIEQNNIHFDFILFDEAHRLRNSNTQLYKGSEALINRSKSVVFLTATPIMISEKNLFNLLSLLDPIKYNEYSTFQNQLSVNKPFINALSLLNRNASFKEIFEFLSTSSVNLFYSYGESVNVNYNKKIKIQDLFSDIPLFNKIINDLNNKADTLENRVLLQYDLSDLSELNKIFSRTRKVDVTQDWSQAIREPKTCLVKLSKFEQDKFNSVINDYIDQNTISDIQGKKFVLSGAELGLVQKKRQISSSVFAYLNTDDNLDRNIDQFESYSDSKIEILLSLISEICDTKNKKIIVFAIFKKTLKYLKIRLKKAGYDSAIIYGDIKDRFTEIENFKNNPKIKILLSSEVGSEGLDMQFCDALVNYDLPWNPMIIEQRIGRIDRFGQKSQKVNIYNFVVKNSIQEEIYTRLLDRIGIFRGCIGDLEAILDKELEEDWNTNHKNIRQYLSSLEKELYSTNLSQEERELKYDKIQKAILIEQRNLKEISEGLTDSLTNDVYFKNEILSIEKHYKYVTENELLNFTKALFNTYLTTCELKKIESTELSYEIHIPLSTPNILINFLNKYKPEEKEQFELFQQFINKIKNEDLIRITFSQEEGFNNNKLYRINAYHPIIVSALICFSENEKKYENTFLYSIKKTDINEVVDFDKIIMAQYKYTIIKKWLGREQEIELLTTLIYDIEKEQVIKNKRLTDSIYSSVQINALANKSLIDFKTFDIQDMSYILTEEISNVENEILEDYKMRLDTSKKMQIQRTNEYYNNIIQNRQLILENHYEKLKYLTDNKEKKNLESIIPAEKGRIDKFQIEKSEAILTLDSGCIKSKTPELLSLSLITIE